MEPIGPGAAEHNPKTHRPTHENRRRVADARPAPVKGGPAQRGNRRKHLQPKKCLADEMPSRRNAYRANTGSTGRLAVLFMTPANDPYQAIAAVMMPR